MIPDRGVTRRRAIAVRQGSRASRNLPEIVAKHNLDIVFTVYIDPDSPHAPRVAVQHALDLDAEVVVAPELDAEHARQTQSWQAVAEIADLVTTTGTIECGLFEPTRD